MPPATLAPPIDHLTLLADELVALLPGQGEQRPIGGLQRDDARVLYVPLARS